FRSIVGRNSRLTTVENARPPAIARAIGKYGGMPSGVSVCSAIAIIARIAVPMLIMIGRRRSRLPSTSASVRASPRRRRLLMCSIITMPLFTTTPISTRMPITALMFISVPVDRKSTRLNSSHVTISYAVLCLKHIVSSQPISIHIRSLPLHPLSAFFPYNDALPISQAFAAAFHQRIGAREPAPAQVVDVLDHHDAVVHDHAHQHQDADHRHDVHLGAG